MTDLIERIRRMAGDVNLVGGLNGHKFAAALLAAMEEVKP